VSPGYPFYVKSSKVKVTAGSQSAKNILKAIKCMAGVSYVIECQASVETIVASTKIMTRHSSGNFCYFSAWPTVYNL